MRRRRERGAVAVEFALVLPLLLMLILGSIDWGYYFFVSEIVGNAAREGARAGAVSRTPGTICAMGGPVLSGVVDYLQRGRLIAGSSDTRLKAFTCADARSSCCQTVNITVGSVTHQAVEVRVSYQTRPGRNSMSITGYLPEYLLPSVAVTTATMRLEP